MTSHIRTNTAQALTTIETNQHKLIQNYNNLTNKIDTITTILDNLATQHQKLATILHQNTQDIDNLYTLTDQTLHTLDTITATHDEQPPPPTT